MEKQAASEVTGEPLEPAGVESAEVRAGAGIDVPVEGESGQPPMGTVSPQQARGLLWLEGRELSPGVARGMIERYGSDLRVG